LRPKKKASKILGKGCRGHVIHLVAVDSAHDRALVKVGYISDITPVYIKIIGEKKWKVIN